MEIDNAEDPLRKCISCTNVPAQLLEKSGATNYFKQFGRITKITLRPKTKACLVEYEHPDSAEYAITQAGEFEGIFFNVTWNTKPEIKKKKAKKDPDPPWTLDPEVQSELEAMGQEFVVKRKYHKRPEEKSIDPPKKERKTKRTWKSTEPIQKPIKTTPTITTKIVTTALLTEQSDLLHIIKQPASTIDDRFKILEARDKLIRLRSRLKGADISKTLHNVGTCPDMCPEKERIMRVIQHQVALYEQEVGGRNLNPHVAVKQYSRSSADQESPLPHDLRNVDVLQMTMGYLIHRIMNLCDNPDCNLGDWFHFLWDRTRGIRKDITQQELCCQGSVELVEQCARFHIHCSARLVAEDPSVFDQKINTENLTKCLQTLKYMYHDLEIKNEKCPHEAEFRAYVILLNLNDANFLWEVQQLRPEIQKSQEIKFALDVYSALDKNNYVKFFKLVKSTTYLNACVLLRYFIQVRIRALRTILKCYAPRAPHTPFPIEELRLILAFEDVASTVDFVEYYGLSVNAQKTHVILDKRNFSLPNNPYALDRAMEFIESKRLCSVGEVVYGNGLPSPIFENHIPHNSFDDDGILKLSEFLNETDIKEMRSKTPIHNIFKERSNSPLNVEVPEPKRTKNIFKIDNRTENLFKRNENSTENIYKLDNRINPVLSTTKSQDTQIIKFGEIPKIQFGGFAALSETKDTQKGIFDRDPKEPLVFGGIQNKESIFGKQIQIFENKSGFEGSQSIFGAPQKKLTIAEPQRIFGDSTFSGFQKAQDTSIFGIPKQGTVFAQTNVNLQPNKTVFDVDATIFGGGSTFSNEKNIFGGLNALKSEPNLFDLTETDSAPVFSKPIKGGFSFKLNAVAEEQKTGDDEDKYVAELELQLKRKNEEYSRICEEEERDLLETKTNELLEAEEAKMAEEFRILAEEKIAEQIRLEQCRLRKIEEDAKLKREEEARLRKEEEDRKKLEELIRAQAEAKKKRELEETMRKEQERKRFLEEEKRRREEENRKKLELERTLEIERTVKSVMEKLLSLTEETHKTQRLKELKCRYLHRRVISNWRSRVAVNKRKRKAIDQSPLWISQRTAKDEAKELFQENQEYNLNLRKRYKNGLPINLVPKVRKLIEKIDLEAVVGNILRKQYVNSAPRAQNDIFWYVDIEISDELTTKEVENNLDLLLKWEERNGRKCLLEQNTNTTYCIERVSYTTHRKISNESNGRIFIADSFSNNLYSKIKNSITKLPQNVQIPIVLILQHKNYNNEAKMYDLVKSGYISDYKIIHNRFTPEKLVGLINEGLQFLAKNVETPPELELNTLKSFLLQFLGTELWKRIGSFAKWNFAYKKCLTDPNVVIGLHNEALERLENILFDQNCYQFANFPCIFKDFVRNKFPDYLPCDYKHFPSFWKEAKYKSLVLKVLKDLKLPQFNEGWPAVDQVELEKKLIAYLNNIFKEPDHVFYKIMGTVLRNFDVTNDLNNILWNQIIEIITMARIESSNYDLIDIYKSKTIFNQLFVIYEVPKLQKYKSEAWFYITNDKIRQRIDLQSEISDKAEQDIRNLHQGADNFNQGIQYNETLAEFDCDIFDEDFDKSVVNLIKTDISVETIIKRKSEFENMQMLMDDLKESMLIQKEISCKFQNVLQDVLEYKSIKKI